MEAITTTAKITALSAKLGKLVFERWSVYRRDQFFEALQEGLQIEQASGEKNQTVDEALDYLLESDENSETLFEAYRKVCFARSKNYGPRIIGLLTAELLNNSMNSDEEEESIFNAAERLSDVQLIEFKGYFAEMLANFGKPTKCGETLFGIGSSIREKQEYGSYQIGANFGSQVDLMPLSLWESHGAWAYILSSCGILTQSMTQKNSPISAVIEHSLREAENVTLFSEISYHPSALRLYKLLLRARGEEDENIRIFPIAAPAFKVDLEEAFGES